MGRSFKDRVESLNSDIVVCHFSDWHTRFRDLPEADIYICTGDMYPDNMDFIRKFDHEQSAIMQTNWVRNTGLDSMRYSIPEDKDIVCLRGNHDFTSLRKLFSDCSPTSVTEFGLEYSVVEIKGIKIGGVRGIPRIRKEGPMYWSDEYTPKQLADDVFVFDNFPKVDILVTHCPPRGLLDNCSEGSFMQDERSVGSRALMAAVDKLRPSLHCFGHIHECGQMVKAYNGIKYSNASGGFNLIKLYLGE